MKRTHSIGNEKRDFDASRVPELPRLNDDLLLQVFTHKSLRRPGASPADYGDNEGLGELGRTAFDLGLTGTLFRRRPILHVSEIRKYRDHLLSTNMIDDWVSHYGLRYRVRCHPKLLNSLKTIQETTFIFYAYVGGVYLTSGPQSVNEWIDGLLEQELQCLFDDAASTPGSLQQSVVVPPPKRTKSEYVSPSVSNPPIFFASQPPATPPQGPPAQLPGGSIGVPNPLAPAQPTLPFLPLFNQAAMQRRVTVEYIAQFSGPAHAGRWEVKCIVNGMCKGEGSGNNKHIAKEEAARRAYYSMGWT
ncbi:hypothetical protein D9613_002139 [Agrocybe pediades]|uniref:Uncharacterized protein n=1 Tax=Agrocybe pediades TaxID=84607 RepID=A0A8H4R697_9AGAR|nr:hypothetical protein D9613_002139 [Agrocybe pediades]